MLGDVEVLAFLWQVYCEFLAYAVHVAETLFLWVVVHLLLFLLLLLFATIFTLFSSLLLLLNDSFLYALRFILTYFHFLFFLLLILDFLLHSFQVGPNNIFLFIFSISS